MPKLGVRGRSLVVLCIRKWTMAILVFFTFPPPLSRLRQWVGGQVKLEIRSTSGYLIIIYVINIYRSLESVDSLQLCFAYQIVLWYYQLFLPFTKPQSTPSKSWRPSSSRNLITFGILNHQPHNQYSAQRVTLIHTSIRSNVPRCAIVQWYSY